MKKKYFYNVWSKFKCNYFKILAWMGFLYVIFLWLMRGENLDTAKVAFVNINSSIPIKILNFLVPFSAFIWLILVYVADDVCKKITNIKERLYLINPSKNQLFSNTKASIKYIKILPILIFLISLILFLYILDPYIRISLLIPKPFYSGISGTVSNKTWPNLLLLITSFAFIIMLLLLIIFNIINKITIIEKNVNIPYIKKFIWFIFVLSLLTFIYASKVYLTNPNFQNIKLGFVYTRRAPFINSKMDVLLLTSTILYVGLISLFLLLVLYTAMTKIMSIKNHIIDIEKNKKPLKVSLSSNGTWIKVLALINILISTGLSVYVYKYFGKNHITIYLPTGTQSPIVSNPVTVVLSITNFYIGVVVSTFLFMVYKVRNDVKFIENNLDIISNK